MIWGRCENFALRALCKISVLIPFPPALGQFFHGSPHLCYSSSIGLEYVELTLHVRWDPWLPHKKKQISKLKSCFKMVFSILRYFAKSKHLKYEEFFYFADKALFILEVFNFILSSFPLFSPVGHCRIYRRSWRNINPKLYSVIMCLNRNLKTQIFWNFWQVTKFLYWNLVFW